LFTLQVKLAELEACLDLHLEKIFLGTTIAVDG
jgi:hypothetical protein